MIYNGSIHLFLSKRYLVVDKSVHVIYEHDARVVLRRDDTVLAPKGNRVAFNGILKFLLFEVFSVEFPHLVDLRVKFKGLSESLGRNGLDC